MKKFFPSLIVLFLLNSSILFGNSHPSINDDLTALFNSLEQQLQDIQGASSTSDLRVEGATVYPSSLLLDGNLAYIVVENTGIRFHQSLFSSESDRFSLLDDLQSYEGDFTVHLLTDKAEAAAVYKVKKGRQNIGFLQFKKQQDDWTLLAFPALNQRDFQSNLELVLQSGLNDFAGLVTSLVLESTDAFKRYRFNLSLHAANLTSFVDLYDGQVYQVIGIYPNFPYEALRTQLEKISVFKNGFEIVDRGIEDGVYKMYLNHQQQEFIIDARPSPKGAYLIVAKNRKNLASTPVKPQTNTGTNPPDNSPITTPSQEPSPSQTEPEQTVNTLPTTEPETTINPPAPALESGTYAFAGKGGKMGCYTGTILDGQRHGQGVFTAKDGTEWEGEWENDQLVRTVTIRRNTGDIYEGAVKNYNRHGYGTYLWRNSGNRFEGDWKNDQRDGKAKYFVAKSGRRFEGTYVDNRIHGLGTWYYKDGTILQGQFVRGKKEGAFTVTTPDGEKQDCTFERGRLVSSGKARLIENYGAVEAEYIKGLKHGPSTIFYNDGTVEQRNYKYGKLDGLVTCTYPDGSIQELEYKNDQLLSSGHLKIKLPHGFFEGDFKAGLKEGPGIVFYNNEVVEDGKYKAGKKEGAFTLVSPEGDVQILPYKNNELIYTGKARLFDINGYYDGRLNKGVREGRGKYVFTDGAILEGEWTNGKKEGRFEKRYPDGQVAAQTYKADRLEKSILIRKEEISCNESAQTGTPAETVVEEPKQNSTTTSTKPSPTAPEKPNTNTEEPSPPTASPEELFEQFVVNFKGVARDRGYKLIRHTRGQEVHKYAALATKAFFDRDKDYLYVAIFKNCPDCEVIMGRGSDDELQYKKPQIKHEGNFTYAVYSFKSLESNTKPIWAYPDPEEKDGEALLFVRE